jgi:hypothetical protein
LRPVARLRHRLRRGKRCSLTIESDWSVPTLHREFGSCCGSQSRAPGFGEQAPVVAGAWSMPQWLRVLGGKARWICPNLAPICAYLRIFARISGFWEKSGKCCELRPAPCGTGIACYGKGRNVKCDAEDSKTSKKRSAGSGLLALAHISSH